MKPWYTSRTLWVNVAFLAVGVLDLAMESLSLSAGQLQWLVFAAGVANLLLRSLTNESLKWK